MLYRLSIEGKKICDLTRHKPALVALDKVGRVCCWVWYTYRMTN